MINIYSQSGQVTYGIKYYTVDTEDERKSLPTKDKMGSKCYVMESKTWYILDGNGEWVPFVGEDSTADAILVSVKNMSAEQKDQLKEELDIEGGGSVEVTPASIIAATERMTEEQIAQTQENLNVVPAVTTIIISSTTVTITPENNHIYKCGELTSLTISNPPANGAYSIVFTSGSTATTTTFPATILGLEDFAAEANTVYEINVLDNRSVIGSWAVSA